MTTPTFSNATLVGTIPEYDGTGSPSSFLEKLTETAALANWKEEQVIRIGKLKLKGAAAEFAHYDTDFKNTTTLNAFQKLLKKQFEVLPKPELALQKLTIGQVQQEQETVRQFAARMKAIAYQAARDVSERPSLLAMAKYFFMKGVHPQIRRQVMSANPATYEDAVDTAEREYQNYLQLVPQGAEARFTDEFQNVAGIQENKTMESLLKHLIQEVADLKKVRGRSRERRSGPNSRQPSRSQSRDGTGNGNFRRSRSRDRQGGGRTCYICGDASHLKANCPRNRRENTGTSRRQMKCDYCQKLGHGWVDCYSRNRDLWGPRMDHAYDPERLANLYPPCSYCQKVGHGVADCYSYKKDQRNQKENLISGGNQNHKLASGTPVAALTTNELQSELASLRDEVRNLFLVSQEEQQVARRVQFSEN